jgi:hypothetical protein
MKMSKSHECKNFMPVSWFKKGMVIEDEWWNEDELHVRFSRRCEAYSKTKSKSKFPYNYRVISNSNIYDHPKEIKNISSIFDFWNKIDKKKKYEV